MMAAVDCQRKRKCVCSSRIVKLEEVVKELDSRLNVVEESLFGLDSMHGRMFQLEKSMENALDRIMPRLDALLGGLPACSVNGAFFRSFFPNPFENNSPSSAKNTSSGYRSQTSCTCSTKNVAASEATGPKTSAANNTVTTVAGSKSSNRSSTPSEAVCTKNNGTNSRNMPKAKAAGCSQSDDPVGSVAGTMPSARSSTPSDAACVRSNATNRQKTSTTTAVSVPSPQVGNSSETSCTRSSSANSNSVEATSASVAVSTQSGNKAPATGVKHISQEDVPANKRCAVVPTTSTSGKEDDDEITVEDMEKKLREAAGFGDVVVCQKLVFDGVNPKSCDSETGDTAMHYASRGGHFGCIMMLLAIEENTALIPNKLGETPLMIAAANGHTSSVQLLVHQCNQSWSHQQLGRKALKQAASDGKVDIVRVLLEGQVSPNPEENSTDISPLHAAASNGHEIVVLMLIHKGADITYSDSDGQTALHKAAMNGHGKCVAALLHEGANPLHKDANGWEPLHLAARAGHIECVKILLAAGVDVNRPAANGESPPLASSPKKCPEMDDVMHTANTTIGLDDDPCDSL